MRHLAKHSDTALLADNAALAAAPACSTKTKLRADIYLRAADAPGNGTAFALVCGANQGHKHRPRCTKP